MAQLVEALRYKPEGRGSDSRWCHWNFSLKILPTSNRNEYQEYLLGRCVGLTTLPPSYADCLQTCEPQTPGTLKACLCVYRDCFTYIIHCQILKKIFGPVNIDNGDRSGTVVKVLRYKSEGRWFDSRWCHWNLSLT